MRIILASSSPRRKELLKSVVKDFEIVNPDAEEATEGDPETLALNNAVLKGKSVKASYDALIACDTIVVLDGKVYGKPYCRERAVETLKKLCGKVHTVISGVYMVAGGEEYRYTVKSEVALKAMTEGEIEEYVDKSRPFDKAGAYGIQDGEVVDFYRGDYDNIVGLPLQMIREVFKRLGYE